MEKSSSSDRSRLEERKGLVEVDGEVLRGAEGGTEDPQTSRRSTSSRRSFRLDYRLEEEVTKSCRDKHGRWTNPWPTWRFPSYSTLLRFLLLDKNHSNVPTTKEVGNTSPGWATPQFLVEMDGLNILTDPIFSQRASPLQFMGPKRVPRAPPLPRINAVVISHSHYDHLDAGSVSSLNARFGGELRWVCYVLVSHHRCECEDLDWWERESVSQVTMMSHLCARPQINTGANAQSWMITR
uniref:N-acyl phosphatidylethanolamine phospholipase D n=1 Tax=Sphaeramia orbicularis TaxID=375764 RepID=A0A673A0R0_9TELE